MIRLFNLQKHHNCCLQFLNYDNGKIPYLKFGTGNNKTLIMSGIHGDEKPAIFIGLECIKQLITQSVGEIYYIPIAVPETFKDNTRRFNDMDPNRCWNHDQIPQVKAIQDFHLEQQFHSVMSLHNYLYAPECNETYFHSNDDIYQEVLNEVCKHNDYKKMIPFLFHSGNEIEWFHRHGAIAVAAELSLDLDLETSRTPKAITSFIKTSSQITYRKAA